MSMVQTMVCLGPFAGGGAEPPPPAPQPRASFGASLSLKGRLVELSLRGEIFPLNRKEILGTLDT